MFITRFILILLLFIVAAGCGESSVEIGENTYSPKIVVEGIVMPGQKVSKIKISRNLPINLSRGVANIFLSNAVVSITEIETGKEHTLVFNPHNLSFEYPGNDLIIQYGKSYQLNVQAVIDGKSLSASSVTTVPQKGFSINRELSRLSPIRYGEEEENGETKSFLLNLNLSPGTTFYPISIIALDANDKTFVYDNPYFEIEERDLNLNIDRYKYQSNQLQNVNSFGGNIEYEIPWLDLWFYGNYRVIVYAADENYRLYFQTFKSVQEFDGNFHEPRFNFKGDGIGVFGSAIADTVFLKVTN